MSRIMFGATDLLTNQYNRVSNVEKEKTFDMKMDNDPITYYKKFCEQYPDVSFRLLDKSNGGGINLGYQGSSNQVGDNYGDYSQCSVSIDISTIKHMMKDPNYEKRISGLVERSQHNYRSDVMYGTKEGWSYMDYNIEEGDNNEPEFSIGYSRVRYSTDAEVKAMWKKEEDAKTWSNLVNDKKNEMFDTFLKMTSSGENYTRNYMQLEDSNKEID